MKSPLKARYLVLIICVLYLIILVGGVLFIGYAHTGMHKEKRMLQVEELAEKYESGEEIDVSYTAIVGLVLDLDGNVVYRFGKESFYSVKPSMDDLSKRYLSKLADGTEIFDLDWYVPREKKEHTSLLFMGVPVREDGRVVGGLIYIMQFEDLLETAYGYMGIVTGFAAIILIILLLHNRSIMSYEKAQKIYIDNVTHELKSPVASVKALAEALSDGMEKSFEDRNVYYGMILKAANIQERLINDILELSKFQGGYIKFEKVDAPASQVFDSIVEKYETSCDLMDMSFEVTDAVRNLPALHTDPKRMAQVLEIFLSNAFKFAGGEGGSIKIDASCARRRATVVVEDNGIGISKEDLPNVTKRFYRAKSALSFKGSGIGLAIAEEIISGLGEKMWIESTEGVGTKVFFTISL